LVDQFAHAAGRDRRLGWCACEHEARELLLAHDQAHGLLDGGLLQVHLILEGHCVHQRHFPHFATPFEAERWGALGVDDKRVEVVVVLLFF
jgi:hypothetical protein